MLGWVLQCQFAKLLQLSQYSMYVCFFSVKWHAIWFFFSVQTVLIAHQGLWLGIHTLSSLTVCLWWIKGWMTEGFFYILTRTYCLFNLLWLTLKNNRSPVTSLHFEWVGHKGNCSVGRKTRKKLSMFMYGVTHTHTIKLKHLKDVYSSWSNLDLIPDKTLENSKMTIQWMSFRLKLNKLSKE